MKTKFIQIFVYVYGIQMQKLLFRRFIDTTCVVLHMHVTPRCLMAVCGYKCTKKCLSLIWNFSILETNKRQQKSQKFHL